MIFKSFFFNISSTSNIAFLHNHHNSNHKSSQIFELAYKSRTTKIIPLASALLIRRCFSLLQNLFSKHKSRSSFFSEESRSIARSDWINFASNCSSFFRKKAVQCGWKAKKLRRINSKLMFNIQLFCFSDFSTASGF